MIAGPPEQYDRILITGDTAHLTIRIDHDALRYFDLRDDDGKVEDVHIRQTHANGDDTTTAEAEITGSREVRHTFCEDDPGEYRIRARVTLADGRQLTIPVNDPVCVWVSGE